MAKDSRGGKRGASGGSVTTQNKPLSEYSQQELKQVYDSIDRMWDATPEERWKLANMFTRDNANKDNFFENSIGYWDLKKRTPSGSPDHVSYNRRNGRISSQYWYTKDGVYRKSNHWGSDVASCSWYIKGRNYDNRGVKVGKTEVAFIKWSDLKAKGSVGHIPPDASPSMIFNNRKPGEYFLIDFKFKK